MTPDTDEISDIALRLAAHFEPGEIKWKAQTVNGNRALAVAFVDARVIQDRLDETLGVMGWQDSYECLPDGAVVCSLRIRLGEEWITKMDVGSPSEQPDEGDRRKAAFSDALKRAAVKFGVGRFLYRLTPQWVDYDPQKRQFVRTPTIPTPQVHVPSTTAPPPPPGRKVNPDDFIIADEGAYLAWMARSRGEDTRSIGERYGIAQLRDLRVKQYRAEIDRLSGMQPTHMKSAQVASGASHGPRAHATKG